jgi:hypothetical protein
MFRLLLPLAFLLALGNLSSADLVWEQVEQRVQHRAEEMTLRTSFKCAMREARRWKSNLPGVAASTEDGRTGSE